MAKAQLTLSFTYHLVMTQSIESQANHYRSICVMGMDLLQREKNYTQTIVRLKLDKLQVKVGRTTFNNILNNKAVGIKNLRITAEGLQKVIRQELGMEWSDGEFTQIKNSDIALKEIPLTKKNETTPGFKIHESGRMSISEKVKFFEDAVFEVIEFGATLNTFTSYFFII